MMKFTTSQSTLSAKLSQLARLVPNSPTHPVLANILIVAKDDRLTLSSFDLSLGLRTGIQATIAEPGAITVPAKLLSEIVSRLPNQDITFETDGMAIAIVCGTGKYKMQGLDADEFPALPTLEKVEGVAVDCDRLQKALSQTLFASSTDESKQILTGAQILVNQDGLRINATDGHRLAVYQDEFPVETDDSFAVTVPARALRELAKVLQKADTVLVKSDQHGAQVSFEVAGENGAECLTCRVLDGQYPNVDQLLPKAFSRQLTVDRQSLLSALDRVAVLAVLKNNIVKLRIGEENLLGRSLFLSADAEGGSGSEEVQCEFTGEPIEIAFNVKYLSDGLKNIGGEAIVISMNDPVMPAIVAPVSGDDGRYLVMPIQVRS